MISPRRAILLGGHRSSDRATSRAKPAVTRRWAAGTPRVRRSGFEASTAEFPTFPTFPSGAQAEFPTFATEVAVGGGAVNEVEERSGGISPGPRRQPEALATSAFEQIISAASQSAGESLSGTAKSSSRNSRKLFASTARRPSPDPSRTITLTAGFRPEAGHLRISAVPASQRHRSPRAALRKLFPQPARRQASPCRNWQIEFAQFPQVLCVDGSNGRVAAHRPRRQALRRGICAFPPFPQANGIAPVGPMTRRRTLLRPGSLARSGA